MQICEKKIESPDLIGKNLNCENNLILFLRNLMKTPARSTLKNIPTLEYVLISTTEAVSGLGKKTNDNTT
jgi:hypothetical protein